MFQLLETTVFLLLPTIVCTIVVLLFTLNILVMTMMTVIAIVVVTTVIVCTRCIEEGLGNGDVPRESSACTDASTTDTEGRGQARP